MQDTQVIDNDFSVGLNTPSSNTLEALAKAGYRSIVSLLPENEGTPSLPLTEEESYARSLGLSFYHFPVSMAEMSPEMINRFSRLLKNPIYEKIAHPFTKGNNDAGTI